MKRFDEFKSLTHFLYVTANIRRDLLVNPKMKIETEADAIESLRFALTILENADYSSLDSLKAPFLEAIQSAGKKNGQVLWPIRVALSGEEFSPGAFELAYILGKETSIQRIQEYLKN